MKKVSVKSDEKPPAAENAGLSRPRGRRTCPQHGGYPDACGCTDEHMDDVLRQAFSGSTEQWKPLTQPDTPARKAARLNAKLLRSRIGGKAPYK